VKTEDSFAAAGLRMLKGCGDPSAYIPPIVAGQVASCPPEEGRIEVQVGIEDPCLLEKANAGWYRLSIEAGLFSEAERRFMVAFTPNENSPSRWICVELQESWDVMGQGASGPLGSGYCRPEFLMHSLDGAVLCCGTTYQYSIGVFTLRDPRRSQVLSRSAEYVATGEIGHPVESASARSWLAMP